MRRKRKRKTSEGEEEVEDVFRLSDNLVRTLDLRLEFIFSSDCFGNDFI